MESAAILIYGDGYNKIKPTAVEIYFVDQVTVDPDAISLQQKLDTVGGSYSRTEVNGNPKAVVKVSTKDLTTDKIVAVLLHELLHVCYSEPAFYLFKPEVKSELSSLANKFRFDADIWRKAVKYKELYQFEEFYVRTVVELIQRRALPFPRCALIVTFLRKYLYQNKGKQTKKGRKYINAALRKLQCTNRKRSVMT